MTVWQLRCENIRDTASAADSWGWHGGPSLGGDSDWGAWREASGAEGQMQLNAKTYISRIFLLPSELTVPPHTTFSHILCFSVHRFLFPCSVTWVICMLPLSLGVDTWQMWRSYSSHNWSLNYYHSRLRLPSTAPCKSQYYSKFRFLPVNLLCQIIQTFRRKIRHL